MWYIYVAFARLSFIYLSFLSISFFPSQIISPLIWLCDDRAGYLGFWVSEGSESVWIIYIYIYISSTTTTHKLIIKKSKLSSPRWRSLKWWGWLYIIATCQSIHQSIKLERLIMNLHPLVVVLSLWDRLKKGAYTHIYIYIRYKMSYSSSSSSSTNSCSSSLLSLLDHFPTPPPPNKSDHLCYVHCNLCDTVLAVCISIPLFLSSFQL